MPDLYTEDFAERTIEPTEHRLEEARTRGQAARSGDLASAAVVLGAGGVLGLLGPDLLAKVRAMMAAMLDARGGGWDAKAAMDSLWPPLWGVLADLAILAGAVSAMAILANVLQVGLRFNSESLQPDWQRVSPVAGLGRLWSARSATRILQTLAKVVLVAAICYGVLGVDGASVGRLVTTSAANLASLAGQEVQSLIFRLGAALLGLAILDWLYQRWQHRRDLRMTPREMRQELKETEGDPQAKRRRLQVARAASQRLVMEAPKWALVLSNSRGLAVAIKLAGAMNRPRVSALGAGAMGRRICELAREAGVPEVEDASTAGSLFRRCRVGHQTPRYLDDCMAELLAYAKEVRACGTGSQPVPAQRENLCHAETT